MSETLLRVRDVTKHFLVGEGIVHKGTLVRAVDGVSFEVRRGETLGLVGESGCGKTTIGKLILRLLEPTAGYIAFQGRDIVKLRGAALKRLRRDLQIIFQDPFASLDPRRNVEYTVSEPMRVHRIPRRERRERARELLSLVGITPEQGRRYPHQFSGGQRQRVGIARALALNPQFVVADEPVSALDVSIQAQILNLMMDLQERFELTYLFISHDLSVVKHVSDRVAIMYLGRVVELADKTVLFQTPLHPYTRALLSAIPQPVPGASRERVILSGDVPSPINIPPGCRFHTRCQLADERCRTEEPSLREVEPGHWVACHYLGSGLDI